MIPLRVRLKGFLCYKDEQEVCFDGSTLWMLSGLNGSGKSAIFDGVTFALFGHHRGGSQKVDELINKNSEGLEVDFEFLQDGQPFRIRRTAKRKSSGGTAGTQQIYRRSSSENNGHNAWDSITDSHKKTDFDKWIANNIGLNYETFTSSVLLLQGKAEKLLDSTAKGRFEVLAGIVDLDRYRKLHEASEDLRRKSDAELKSFRDRLAGLPEVSSMELLEAETAVGLAEKIKEETWLELERLRSVEFQSQGWLEKTRQLEQSRKLFADAQSLLADGDRIEREARRLEELQKILPIVKSVSDQQTQIRNGEQTLLKLTEQEKRIQQELTKQEGVLDQLRQKRSILETKNHEENRRLREVESQLRTAAAALAKLKEYERQKADLLRLEEEIKQMPDDPSNDLKLSREEFDRLSALNQLVPQLTRFDGLRGELSEIRKQGKTAAEELNRIEKHGLQLKSEVEKLEKDLTLALASKQQADENATRSRTLLEQSKQSLDDLQQVGGSKVCRHCGQELTPAHIEEETRRRKKELAECEQRYKESLEKQESSAAREKQLREEFTRKNKAREDARVEFRGHKQQVDQAKQEMERLQLDCRRTFLELPDSFRSKISNDASPDWLQTVYPTRAELGSLKGEQSRLEPARKRWKVCEELFNNWNLLKGREANLRQSLSRMESELPPDRQHLREQHLSLETEEQTLEASLKAIHSALGANQKEIDQSARTRERIHGDLLKLQGEINTQKATLEHCRRELSRQIKSLPDEWKERMENVGLADFQAWDAERNQLVEKGTEERARQLHLARMQIESIRVQCVDLENQLQQYSEEVRQGPEVIQARLKETHENYKNQEEDLNLARKHFDNLERDYNLREQWQKEYKEADRRLAHAKILSELLGRERLQLHLVRQAERQVIDHANSVLDRLSGGELFLRLSGEAGGDGNNAKALELEAHNRITGEKPINVSFLSGSQKFRVAVSLALGIGQYASRQHRPIESVIIDEGFGCLDRNARQVMIQELQNLRTQMRCILLVSHQEEFADAFADGYHFELSNGTTIAKRFQR